MGCDKAFEDYPLCIVFASNLVSISLYAVGAFIMSRVGLLWAGLYLLYVLVLELRLLSGGCVNCFYYGRWCAFGRGKLSSLLFKRGDAKKFMAREIGWKDIIPDFLVSIIPMVAAVALLVMRFSWLMLGLLVVIFLLGFPGTGMVRGLLACKYCRQRELGCPAEKLFGKKK